MGRNTCYRCFRTQELCLCSFIEPFEIEPLIVLLVHPREFMKTVGTVRIVKQALKNSILLRGNGPQFENDPILDRLIKDPKHFPMVLFPGNSSLNLSAASEPEINERIPSERRLVIFVIDGTWTEAKQIIRLCPKLQQLPKISFEVKVKSNYEFRKQPEDYCLSTVEAVSLLIDQLSERKLCKRPTNNAHHSMLNAFKKMVASQVSFENSNRMNNRSEKGN